MSIRRGNVTETGRRVGRVARQDRALSPLGRRVRAAMVLSSLTAGDVAPELNISPRTFERLLYGEREVRDWEIRRLAQLTEVPEAFLRDGFSSPDQLASGSEESVLLRLETVAAQLQETSAALVRALAAERSSPDSPPVAQDG
jgi:hypothetical protein